MGMQRLPIVFLFLIYALNAFGAESSMENLLFTGRWDVGNSSAKTSAPAAMVQFDAEAKSLTFELDGDSRWRLDTDGKDSKFFETHGRMAKEIKGLDGVRHRYRLIKMSETNPGFVTLFKISTDVSGKFYPKPKASERRIEFIGDSFTVGFGNEGNAADNPEMVFERTDASRSYAFLLADGFKADFQVNAASGRGLVRNYANIVPEWTLRDLYKYTVPGEAPDNPNATLYDLNSFHPQVIVIFVGINDFQGEPPYADKKKFMSAYVEFLSMLRKAHPGVKFLLVSTKVWPNDDLTPTVKKIYEAERDAGHGDVEFVSILTENTALLGHPSIHSHVDMAQNMRQTIGRLGKWLSR